MWVPIKGMKIGLWNCSLCSVLALVKHLIIQNPPPHFHESPFKDLWPVPSFVPCLKVNVILPHYRLCLKESSETLLFSIITTIFLLHEECSTRYPNALGTIGGYP
jgi:hypothetical protein